jgi:hypothetical protein
MDNLGAETVGSMLISVPPLRLQRLIADYLDRQTARLDGLGAAKERNLFVERMDQNEEIFVRFMNVLPFQKEVTAWMASEAYRRMRGGAAGESPVAAPGDGVTETRPTLRIVQPRPEERYVTCVPLVPLKAAAGAFSDPQHV